MSSASKTERHMNRRTQAAFDLSLTILCHAPDRNPRRSTASHNASIDQRASPHHEPMPPVVKGRLWRVRSVSRCTGESSPDRIPPTSTACLALAGTAALGPHLARDPTKTPTRPLISGSARTRHRSGNEVGTAVTSSRRAECQRHAKTGSGPLSVIELVASRGEEDALTE